MQFIEATFLRIPQTECHNEAAAAGSLLWNGFPSLPESIKIMLHLLLYVLFLWLFLLLCSYFSPYDIYSFMVMLYVIIIFGILYQINLASSIFSASFSFDFLLIFLFFLLLFLSIVPFLLFRPFLPYGVTFCRTILTEVRQFGLNEILSLC